jgi:protein-S-isoprenylcysteine O-methyltransferase Ste14
VLRAGVVTLLLVFFVHRLSQYADYFFKPLWVAETLIYVVFIVSYAIRLDPLVRSLGVKEILVPLVGAVLPFALLFTRPAPWIVHRTPCLYAVFSLMTASTAFTVWGLWTLRRSFSITVEARDVVNGGPYRLVRHPVYLGEMCTAAVVMAWRFSILNVALFALFVVIQLARARWEEAKLARAFPTYLQYSQRTWWFGGKGR